MESKKKVTQQVKALPTRTINAVEESMAVVQKFELSLDDKNRKANEAEVEYNKYQIWEKGIENKASELQECLNEYWSNCRQIELDELQASNALTAELQRFKEQPELYLEELGLSSMGQDLESLEEGEIFSSSGDEEEIEAGNNGTLVKSSKGTEYSSKCVEAASKLLANCGTGQDGNNATCGPLKLKSGYDCLFTFKEQGGKKITTRGIGDNAVLAFDDARERLHKVFATKENQVHED